MSDEPAKDGEPTNEPVPGGEPADEPAPEGEAADEPARGGEPASRSVKRLRDPRALRALAHPIRLSIVGLLRTEGPLTATRAAELLGESSASASFHLRQLAKYGLVEEAGGGKGRERPWRATAMFTNLPEAADSPELAMAADLLSSVIAERYFEEVMQWLGTRGDQPPEWQRAAQFGDTFLYVTADELAALGEQTQQMVDQYLDRQVNPELRPPGARLVSYLHLAFPRTGPLPPRAAGGSADAGGGSGGAGGGSRIPGSSGGTGGEGGTGGGADEAGQ
jgi:DNA-binding transcriptional ArsR family regulator